jgi:hypothetical protein
MRTTTGVGDYASWLGNAERHDLGGGLAVLVGSPVDLLASKEAAGRDKDLAALPRIRAELVAAGVLRMEDVRGPFAELEGETPAYPAAIELLGDRPDDLRARALWEHVASVVRDFRERWGLADDPRPLGPPAPESDPTATDRENVLRQLQRTRRLLDHAMSSREVQRLVFVLT